MGAYDKDENLFSTTGFLMKIAKKKNGVSKLHTFFEKKKHPQSTLIPITNGVYRKRWQADTIHSDDILAEKIKLRTVLFDHIKKVTGKKLNPRICTLIWARRLVSYKRPYLLFSDKERLIEIIKSKKMPLQIVISGRAHLSDKEGQETAKKITDFVESLGKNTKVVYLSQYNLNLAHKLVQGADIWLNTPELGLEACGTSGMKAGLNGALQCSIQDGWVSEVSWKGKGWSLPEDNTANILYDMLEKEILPCFYNDSETWVKKMRATIDTVEKSYTTQRMLDEYLKELYN
jgi:starch phosphorylase